MNLAIMRLNVIFSLSAYEIDKQTGISFSEILLVSVYTCGMYTTSQTDR